MTRDPRPLRERLSSPVVAHSAGVATLAILLLSLLILLFTSDSFSNSARERRLAVKRAEIARLKADIAQYGGVSQEIHETRTAIDAFYADRIATSYSRVTSSIGAIAISSGVQLSQIQYTEGAPGGELTELSMDAGVTGDYPQVMRFVNGVERDRVFYMIRALSFTGQQGNVVSLRIRISTWLRPPVDSGPQITPSAFDKHSAKDAVPAPPGGE